MKWVPQSHTVEKYLSQDGFIPLSLAPKLEMFYLFTSVHEALSLRQRHRDFQGVPAAFSFVGSISTATYPCTICPCSSHCNTLVCHRQWLPPLEAFLSATTDYTPRPRLPFEHSRELNLRESVSLSWVSPPSAAE